MHSLLLKTKICKTVTLILSPLQMYLHHPLWLLLLVVGSGGSRKHSRKYKDYETQRHKHKESFTEEPPDLDYDYYYDDYLESVQGDRGQSMIHDTQQIPNRNKLLIIVLGG